MHPFLVRRLVALSSPMSLGTGALAVADDIVIKLSRDQALVLFEWLARTGAAGRPATFEDQAERRALWNLEASLESVLSEPLRENYRQLVEAAQARLRDVED